MCGWSDDFRKLRIFELELLEPSGLYSFTLNVTKMHPYTLEVSAFWGKDIKIIEWLESVYSNIYKDAP